MPVKKTVSSKKQTPAQRKKETADENNSHKNEIKSEVFLWGIIAISLLLLISNFRIGGVVGNTISNFLFGLFGIISYIFPVLLLIGSFFAVSNKDNFIALRKLISTLVFFLFICFLAELVVHGNEPLGLKEAFSYCFEKRTGGGIIGASLANLFVSAFGLIGAYIVDITTLIICVILVTGHSAMKGVKNRTRQAYDSVKQTNERHRESLRQRSEEKRMDRKIKGITMNTLLTGNPQEPSIEEMNELFPPEKTGFEPSPVMTEKKPSAAPTVVAKKIPLEPEAKTKEQEASIAEPPDGSSPSTAKRKEILSEKERKQETDFVSSMIHEEPVIKPYIFPPLDLLKKPIRKTNGNTQQQLKETAWKLQQTLKNFGVDVRVTDISCGPAVTRYEIQPETGVKVSRIVNLADDIKLNLAAADIRIEAPIPGKAAVGIEVPNKENIMVSFRELIESQEFQNAKSKIAFAAGKDISGKVVVTDIAKMPHLLIAGATGSGKSVCINTIIMSILYRADPNEVKIMMIDPKVVELSVYNGIPHLLIPVVTDPKKAAGALHWAVMEMTERYNKFAEANVREINGYNEKISHMELPEGQERPVKLPQIVIIVDELADLMMVASGDVEEAICRLAQLARAAGIHLVIATQRPSVNVITGLIKANMPSRIAFAVTSGIDSRTVLDMNGAEKLLGKGDMLFHPQGLPKPVRVQGAFVSDKEVADVVQFLTNQNGQAEYSNEIQKKMDSIQAGNTSTIISEPDPDMDGDGRDSYFHEAAKIFIDKDKASIGMLQRYLKIGFNRAARIMDQLEEAGIVGPEEGTKPRKILMNLEEFEQFTKEEDDK